MLPAERNPDDAAELERTRPRVVDNVLPRDDVLAIVATLGDRFERKALEMLELSQGDELDTSESRASAWGSGLAYAQAAEAVSGAILMLLAEREKGH